MNHDILQFFEVPFVKTIVSFIILIDPVGLIPLFLTLTATYNASRKAKTILTSCTILFILMVAFLFVGKHFLEILNISVAAFKIGGGIVLLLMAIAMLNIEPKHTLAVCENQDSAQQNQENIAIVPFAVPVLFGPALISVLVVYAEKAHSIYYQLGLVVCALISAIISGLIFATSVPLMKKVGKKGFDTINSIMGLIIIAIAVQFFLDGLKMAFPILASK